MKFESLNYQQRQAMEREYDLRHADELPEEPKFEEPTGSARVVIGADYKTDVYCRLNSGGRHHSDATGSMRLVGSSEHLQIEFKDSASIRRLISELSKLADDIDVYNSDLRAHLARSKQYKSDMATYEQQREKALREALKSGKYTGEQIDLNMDDIPF